MFLPRFVRCAITSTSSASASKTGPNDCLPTVHKDSADSCPLSHSISGDYVDGNPYSYVHNVWSRCISDKSSKWLAYGEIRIHEQILFSLFFRFLSWDFLFFRYEGIGEENTKLLWASSKYWDEDWMIVIEFIEVQTCWQYISLLSIKGKKNAQLVDE